MTNEVKEILDSIKYHVDEDDWFEIEGHFLKPLLDYITNLQEENKRLIKNQRYYKNGVFSLEYDKETMSDMIDELYSRIDKANELLKGIRIYGMRSGKTYLIDFLNKLDKILNGCGEDA